MNFQWRLIKERIWQSWFSFFFFQLSSFQPFLCHLFCASFVALFKALKYIARWTFFSDVLKEASDRIVSKRCVGLLFYLTLAKLTLLWLAVRYPDYWFSVQFNCTFHSSEICLLRKCPSFVESNHRRFSIQLSRATATTFLRLFHCSFNSFSFPSQTSELELENFFSSFGEVVDVRIVCDRKTGLNKGWGFRVILPASIQMQRVVKRTIKKRQGSSSNCGKAWTKDHTHGTLQDDFSGNGCI